MKDFNFIIIGGGCAGLSLAYELEIHKKLEKLNFKNIETDGFNFNLFSQNWKKSKDCSVNYIIVAEKI